MIWPLFIYAIFGSIKSVAAIPVIVALTTIVFTYFTGKIQKANRNILLSVGSILIAITWVLRIVLENDIFYYVSVVFVGLFTILVSLPLDSNIFEQGERKNALAASTYRNTFSMFPRIFFYGLLFVLLEVFKVSFVAAAISMFIIAVFNSLFILNRKREKVPVKPI